MAMTKLTKEQIEQERIKFEAWFNNFYEDDIGEYWEENRNCYKYFPIHTSYKGWLARAELEKGGE